MAYACIALSTDEYKACKEKGGVIEVPLTDVLIVRAGGKTDFRASVDLASLQRSQSSEHRKLLLSVSSIK